MTVVQLGAIFGLLACVVALASLGRFIRLPYPTMMVIAGLGIALIDGLPRIRLDPDLVFLVFLPPILYAAAWNTWWKDFRRNARPIAWMAVGLVLATAAGVAAIAHWAIPGMSWGVAFLLGAIVSPPDAAAATAIAQRLKVSRRIVTILEGESLVNDASGLITYRVTVAAIVGMGHWSVGEAAWDLLRAGVGGVAVGLAAGVLIEQLHRRMREPTVTTALSLLAPYMAYLPAEMLHASGVLAAVAAGLYVSVRSPKIFTPEARVQSTHVWAILTLLLNGLVFVLIGLQLEEVMAAARQYSILDLAWYSFAVSTAAVAVRFAWVFGMAYLAPILPWVQPMRMGWQPLTVIAWTGMRGIVSLAAAMALPLAMDNGQPFPHRDLIVLLTFGVIFATLVIQSLSLPLVIRMLGPSVADDNEYEEIVARLMSAGTALKRLEEMAAAAPQDQTIEQVRRDYLARVNLAAAEVKGETIAGRGRSRPEDRVRLEAIAAERRTIVEMRDRGELSEDVFRRIERDLDLEEWRVS